MSHVDEGLVHAYLDDALDDVRRAGFEHHIAECAECAALLREEERVRDAAASLLVRAAPDEVAAPPFASVRARSSDAPVLARAPRRVPRLAWAAMLVIGLGSAVMTARYIQPDFGSKEQLSDMAPAAPAASMPEVPQAAQTQATAEERVASGAGGGATADGAQPSARNEAPPPPAPARALAERDAAPPALQQQRADTRELAARQRDARAESRTSERELARGADRPGVADAVTGAIAAAPSPPPPAPAPAAPRPAPSSEFEVTSGRSAVANAWRASTQAEAEELLGAPIARVPGVALLSVEVLPSEPPLIRVRQPLGAVVLELTQQRIPSNGRPAERAQDALRSLRNSAGAAEGSESRAMAKTSAPSVAVRRGDVLITAQAPVTADSLSALLRRIE